MYTPFRFCQTGVAIACMISARGSGNPIASGCITQRATGDKKKKEEAMLRLFNLQPWPDVLERENTMMRGKKLLRRNLIVHAEMDSAPTKSGPSYGIGYTILKSVLSSIWSCYPWIVSVRYSHIIFFKAIGRRVMHQKHHREIKFAKKRKRKTSLTTLYYTPLKR